MTKEEALAKIKELQEYVENLDKEPGFEEDEIFLLSVEEYEKYKNVIPEYGFWWWLRSLGDSSYKSANVYSDGSINFSGNYINYKNICVRPAYKLSDEQIRFSSPLKVGQRIFMYSFPWIYLGDGIAIAEVPIGTHRFDEKSNDYATSEIRQWLKEWKRGR